MASTTCGKFVSRKINKVRWRPVSSRLGISCDSFVSGSWDDEDNQLALWKFSLEDEEEPLLLCSQSHAGDVTEIKFLDSENFVASSSLGGVALYSTVLTPRSSINKRVTWDGIHNFKNSSCSCTGLAVFDEDILTVGEDGKINLLTARLKQPVRVIEGCESSSILSVCFLKHFEALTGNLRGQLKVWDLRQGSNNPSSTFVMSRSLSEGGSNKQPGVFCVTHHPTQGHIVVAGGEDGDLTIWDLRRSDFPVSLLDAHSLPVTEVHFHEQEPNHLFTCSMSGQVWHWNASAMYLNLNASSLLQSQNSFTDASPWLGMDGSKKRLKVISLLPGIHKPVNSLDVAGNALVCGADNEAIYTYGNLEF